MWLSRLLTHSVVESLAKKEGGGSKEGVQFGVAP